MKQGYTIYVRNDPPREDWMHYGWRQSEEKAVETVLQMIEDGRPAFYIPGVHVELDGWDIEVDPAA